MSSVPPYGQPPNPAMRPYAPMPNGYLLMPQGMMPPPGGFFLSLYISVSKAIYVSCGGVYCMLNVCLFVVFDKNFNCCCLNV